MNTAPLRKIISSNTDSDTLECGHLIERKKYIFGQKTVFRRRCYECLHINIKETTSGTKLSLVLNV